MLDPRQAETSPAEQSQLDCGEHETPFGEVSAWLGVGGLQLSDPGVLYGPLVPYGAGTEGVKAF